MGRCGTDSGTCIYWRVCSAFCVVILGLSSVVRVYSGCMCVWVASSRPVRVCLWPGTLGVCGQGKVSCVSGSVLPISVAKKRSVCVCGGVQLLCFWPSGGWCVWLYIAGMCACATEERLVCVAE